jgi:hypothetical protein
VGFVGTLKAIKENDLSFGNFPWLLVGGAFLLSLGVGVGLMFFEADRPLRRLTADAVRLAKGETERMTEDAYAGKFGSIARSVNIHIDKLGREARSAKKDLDQLLGPAPEGSLGSLGTIDLLATALPTVRPGGPAPAVAPPPSEFRFHESQSIPVRKPPVRAATPPAFKAVTAPPPAPPPRTAPPPPHAPPPAFAPPPAYSAPSGFAPSGSLSLDDDILGRGEPVARAAPAPRVDPYFRQVFDQFVAAKQSCGESIAGLVFEKFAEKLVRNRDDLMAKTGCRDVRFTVYVKDGKAALKATPVKDEA